MLELAEEQGVQLPADTPEGLRKALHCGEKAGSLVDTTLKVLQTAEALYRVAHELSEDAAAENVRYMEVRYSPMLHTRGGLRLTTVVEAVLAGLWDAQKDYGVVGNAIVCGILRHSEHLA